MTPKRLLHCKDPERGRHTKTAALELSSELAGRVIGPRISSHRSWLESPPPQIWGEAFKNLANFHFPRHVTFCLSLGTQEPPPPSWREGFSSEETAMQHSDALEFIFLHNCLTRNACYLCGIETVKGEFWVSSGFLEGKRPA